MIQIHHAIFLVLVAGSGVDNIKALLSQETKRSYDKLFTQMKATTEYKGGIRIRNQVAAFTF